MAILAAAFVFAAVCAAVLFFLRPKGVPMAEEWKARHIPVRRGERAFYTVLGGLACSVAAYAVTGQLHLAAIAFTGGFFVSGWLVRKKSEARRALLRDQYVQALNALISALQGGMSPYQALEDAVPSMPRPARDVFAEILRRTRTGSTFVDAAESVMREVGWDDIKSLCVALRLYSRTGCNLVEVFQHLVETVYERQSDEKYIAAVTAQVRATAAILSVLPFALMGILRAAAPNFAAPLFTTLAGNGVVLLCTAMILLGNRIIGRIVSKLTGRI